MFEGLEEIAARDVAPGKDGLRRVAWAELAAAISLARAMRTHDEGLLAQAGPSFGRSRATGQETAKDERGVNLESLARRKGPGGNNLISAELSPERHRENT